MKHPKKLKLTPRKKRARRVRRKIYGTPERPRLAVFRSLKNVYVQLIDDTNSVSLIGISSTCAEIKVQQIEGSKVGVARAVGKIVAEKAREKDITKVVFDRSGYLYHGRVRAVAEGAREEGLLF